MQDQTRSVQAVSSLFTYVIFTFLFIGLANAQPTVSSFTLVNADNDTDIAILNDGDTLILNLLPSTKLNIRANTNPTSVDKVSFDYDGVSNFRSESIAPYTLYGDKNGDYNEWTPTAGAHVLAADAKLAIVTGPQHIVNFFVIPQVLVDCNGDNNGLAYLDDCGVCVGGNTGLLPNLDKDSCGVCFGDGSSCVGCNAPNVLSLSLINTDNGADLGIINDGDTIDETQIFNFSIRANACNLNTESVQFLVDNVPYYVDNGNPYAINGNSGSLYNSWNADSGIHVITAIPYSQNNASGTAGVPFSLSLLFIDSGFVDTTVFGSLPNSICDSFSGGRIALSFDGNIHDLDDHAAMPMAMAMLYYAGLQDSVVHIEYNNHLGLSDSSYENGMRAAAQGAQKRFNYDESIIYDALLYPDSASDALAAAINLSSSSSPLWILAGGPMETTYRGIAKADSTKRQFVRVVSHSQWNQNHRHGGTGLDNDWDDLLLSFSDDSVEFIELPDMNGGNGFTRFRGPRSYWRWLINDPDTNFHWLYSQNKLAPFDVSDAGMAYWLLSGGDTTASAEATRALFETPCQTGCTCACDTNIAGSAMMITPNDSDQFAMGTNILFETDVVDPDSNISYVQLYSADVLLATDSSGSYQFSTSVLDSGFHQVYCRVVDSCEALSYSDTIIIEVQSNDCAGILGGSAYLDDCGICVGGSTGVLANLDKDTCGVCFGDNLSCVPVDCFGDTLGTAAVDSCGICSGGNTGIVPNSSCDDCNGDANGSAFIDTCGVCVGGASGNIAGASCSDCNGDPNGSASMDSCGVCSGGATGVVPNTSCLDCNNDLDGVAFIDNCGICAGGNTGIIPDSSCTDCAGDLNGLASIDTCGVCAGGNTGIVPNQSCASCLPGQVSSLTLMQEGLGGPIQQLENGDIIYTAIVGDFSIRADICNDTTVGSVVFTLNGIDIRNENVSPYAINGDNSNGFRAWNPGNGSYTLTATPYSKSNGNGIQGIAKTVVFTISNNPPQVDCNGDTAGTAFIDECGICAGGNTANIPNATCSDCNGDPNGSARIDDCEICSGGSTGLTPNASCLDCDGVLYGTAMIDACGVCSGGATGILPNSSCLDCNEDPNGTAVIDDCGDCVLGNTGLLFNEGCSIDCNGDIDGTASIDDCGVCSGGLTGIEPNISCIDCNEEVNGTAIIDDCGICSGGSTGLVINETCTDCAGVPNGSAKIDTCNVCAGGSTGVVPNSTCASCVPNEVVSFVLMQAGSGGVPLGNINNGDVIIKSVVGPFSIDAQVCDDNAVESVIFTLDGDNIKLENSPPYSINGDNSNGGFNAWNIAAGSYTLTVTPYSNNNAGGTVGVAKTVSFTVLDQGNFIDCNNDTNGTASIDLCNVCSGGNTGITPNSTCVDCNGVAYGTASIDTCGVCSGGNTGIVPNTSCGGGCSSPNEVETLMLIDASSNQDLGGLANGDTINLNILPSFSLRADVCSNPDVESVEFSLNGNVIRTESVPPYAVNGDNNGGYNPWPLAPGTYTIVGTPYSANNAGGTQGVAKAVTFYVVSGQATADCNGDVGGTAYLDACGNCVGGNTGQSPCSTPAGCGEFIEQGGLVVVELESVSATNNDWYTGTGPIYDFNTLTNPSGGFYYMWKKTCVSGSSSNWIYTTCGSTTKGNSIDYISYTVKINTPGRYRFQMRSWQTSESSGSHGNSTENNDFWLRLPDGGGVKKKGGNEITIGNNEDVKIYQNTTNNWVWISNTVDNNPHQIYIDIPAAGSYEIEIGGRSSLLALDRFVLYLSDNPSTNVSESFATSMSRPESPRGSCGGAKVVSGSGQSTTGTQQGKQSESLANGGALAIPEVPQTEVFEMTVYPNPTTGKLNIGILPADGNALVELFDATGKLLLKQQQAGENNSVDLSPYANGLYWIKVHSGSAIRMQKVYKK